MPPPARPGTCRTCRPSGLKANGRPACTPPGQSGMAGLRTILALIDLALQMFDPDAQRKWLSDQWDALFFQHHHGVAGAVPDGQNDLAHRPGFRQPGSVLELAADDDLLQLTDRAVCSGCSRVFSSALVAGCHTDQVVEAGAKIEGASELLNGSGGWWSQRRRADRCRHVAWIRPECWHGPRLRPVLPGQPGSAGP